jgi:hypothetical protein
VSPAHEQFANCLEFLTTQRFCKNICPVAVRVNLYHFNVPVAYLIMKMVPFYGNVLCPYFLLGRSCQHYAGLVIFKNLGGSQGRCSSGMEKIAQGCVDKAMLVNLLHEMTKRKEFL